MKLYRCLHKTEYKLLSQGKNDQLLNFVESRKNESNVSRGTNTFDYSDGENKIHFFLYGQNAQQHVVEDRKDPQNYRIIQYDMPYEIMKKYKGYGYYSRIFPGYHIPLPEFSLPFELYSSVHITGISEKLPFFWKSPNYKKYLKQIPREVCYENGFLGGGFLPGYNEYTILKAPFEKICGIDEKKEAKQKIKR